MRRSANGRSAGCSLRIAVIASIAVSPRNAREPESISYKTAPKAKTSDAVIGRQAPDLLRRHVARLSRARRRACIWRRGREHAERRGPDSSCVSFARPKSRIFTRPSLVMKTFSGFRSRCTMPFSCAAARPRRDLHRVLDGFAHRQRRRRPSRSRKRLALEQLRHDVRRTLMLTDIIDGKDVGVVERRRRARLLFETPQPGRSRSPAGQDLDGHIAAQPRVARPIDFAHAAGPDERDIS